VRSEIRNAKLRYKDKMEAELSSNNLKKAWNGMKTMTGLQRRGNDKDLADNLNSFYLRF